MEHTGRPGLVELTDPFTDNHCRDGVSGEVGQCSSLGHEPVDAHNQTNALNEVRLMRL